MIAQEYTYIASHLIYPISFKTFIFVSNSAECSYFKVTFKYKY